MTSDAVLVEAATEIVTKTCWGVVAPVNAPQRTEYADKELFDAAATFLKQQFQAATETKEHEA